MMGIKTCATCKYFKPLTMLSSSERIKVLSEVTLIDAENADSYGLCSYFNKIVYKHDGGECKHWEVKLR